MKTMTRRLGLQIIAGAAAAPAAATTTTPLANPDAEQIELGRQFVELARHRDAVNDESDRLYDIACLSYPPGTVYEARLRGAAAEAAYTAAIDAADEAVGLPAVQDEFEDAMD